MAASSRWPGSTGEGAGVGVGELGTSWPRCSDSPASPSPLVREGETGPYAIASSCTVGLGSPSGDPGSGDGASAQAPSPPSGLPAEGDGPQAIAAAGGGLGE